MVVLGTRPEYFNAVWVKNEWSRYLAIVKQSGGKKVLIPAYRDMDPYDLPDEFSHLQAQDMSKLGFMQDLIRGIKKIASAAESKTTVKETVVVNNNANIAPLLKRAFMFLEDGEWEKADDFCEQVLNQDPENAQAYIGKLMAELHIKKQENLADCKQPFDDNKHYQKAIRFGDEKIKKTLSGYIDHINERNENDRLTGIYNDAVNAMNDANSEYSYKMAANKFKTIPGFKDADSLAEKCLEKAEICRKDDIYSSALSLMRKDEIEEYETAITKFRKISGWKDADEQINICKRKIEEIKAQEEAHCLELERKAEEQRIAAEKAKKKRKRIIAIISAVTATCTAFVILLITVIIPNVKYNAAIELYNAGKYEEAITAFTELNGYKDSASQITECKYSIAMDLYNAGEYENAIAAFTELYGFKDSAEQIKNCKTSLLRNASVGDIVYFGTYEQDNNTSNGKEEVEWLVLAKEENKALVISKYALDCQRYNSSYTDVTWETCSLRKWLNETFVAAAFSPEEQNIILNSTVTADNNPNYYSTSPGNNTTDKVFLLSIPEVKKYFSSDATRRNVPTDYAIAQGASSSYTNNCCWLRSPGKHSRNATLIDSVGSINSIGKTVYDSNAVRPAMWIDLG